MIDIFDILFKHFTTQLKPEKLFKTQVMPQNATSQRYIVVNEYYAFMATSFKALPNEIRYQFLSCDTSEAKSRQLAYFVANKISENYNIDLDSNGDIVPVNGQYHIASIKSIQLPIFLGLVSGGGYQYSQNFEVRF
jgi:hypothetical protein